MNTKIMCRECNSQSEEIKSVQSEMVIKNKKVEVVALRKICSNCKNIKFDKDLDQAFSLIAIKKYNELYGVDGNAIVELRKSFGISQETLGKVLGVAKKTIVAYENEKTIPNDSYFTLIKSLLEDKTRFFHYAKINKDKLSEYEIKKIFENNTQSPDFTCNPFQLVLHEEPSPYNGYQVNNEDNIMKYIQYIASKIKGKTKLAKTLFFADAIAYSETASSLTGIQYAAINNGPIPDQYDSILEYMINKGMLTLEIEEVHDYTQYNYYTNNPVELDEKQTYYIDKAINFTMNKTALELSKITHTLEVWNQTKIGSLMSFDLLDGFNLDEL